MALYVFIFNTMNEYEMFPLAAHTSLLHAHLVYKLHLPDSAEGTLTHLPIDHLSKNKVREQREERGAWSTVVTRSAAADLVI